MDDQERTEREEREANEREEREKLERVSPTTHVEEAKVEETTRRERRGERWNEVALRIFCFHASLFVVVVTLMEEGERGWGSFARLVSAQGGL